MRQGEIYDLVVGGGRFRVVVISADHHIATGHPPLCAPLLRTSLAFDLRPYVVTLTDTDSVGGVVQVGKLAAVAIPPGVAPVGMVSGASMQRIISAVGELLRD
ncbi:MAG: hypothetical protein JXA67_09270 [Micromonosporaceae bacterium]|nr:hypothetical protein [Micromonosporaceae bacterium]